MKTIDLISSISKVDDLLESREYSFIQFKAGISKLDAITLEIIIDNIFEYKSLEDVKKYIL